MFSRTEDGKGIRFTRGDFEGLPYTLIALTLHFQRPRITRIRSRAHCVQIVCGPLLVMQLSPLRGARISSAAAVILGALALFALPVQAHAASVHRARGVARDTHGKVRHVAPTKPPARTLADDLQAAREYWGWSRSAQCTTESWSEQPMMWAGWERAEGTMIEPGECTAAVLELPLIEAHLKQLQPTDEGYAPAKRIPWKALELRCRIVVHEDGHMLGLSHDPSEYNPMYWRVTWKPIIPQCEGL